MKKIKLLFDTQQLDNFGSGKQTGLYRFADEVFKKLAESDEIDLYCYLDKKHKNVKKYLELNYQNPEKIIHLPNLTKTTRDRNFFIRLKSRIHYILLAKKYGKIVQQFDWYFSPFNPISPIIYKNLKSSIFIHDLIPIVCNDITCQKFTKSYAKFIKNLKCDFVFFNSQATRNDFLRFRPDFNEKNTLVTLLAADEKFKPNNDQALIAVTRRKYNIATEKYFLSVSDFNPRKNILFTIRNFLHFAKENNCQDISLVLAGPNKNMNRALLDELEFFSQFKDKIIFTGFVDDADLPTLYSGALAFIYTSLYEGFGLPPLEAMQSGTPTITSNTSSLPEVIGDAGILIDPTNDGALVQSMKDIYNSEFLRKELSEKGRERAAIFSWDSLAFDLITTWKNYLQLRA